MTEDTQFVALEDYTKECKCGFGFQVKEITKEGNRYFCIGCNDSYFEPNQTKKVVPCPSINKTYYLSQKHNAEFTVASRLSLGETGSLVDGKREELPRGLNSTGGMSLPRGLINSDYLFGKNLKDEQEMIKRISMFPPEALVEFAQLEALYIKDREAAINRAVELYLKWDKFCNDN